MLVLNQPAAGIGHHIDIGLVVQVAVGILPGREPQSQQGRLATDRLTGGWRLHQRQVRFRTTILLGTDGLSMGIAFIAGSRGTLPRRASAEVLRHAQAVATVAGGAVRALRP